MEDKTIHYTLAFAVIFVFLVGVNQLVHTYEKKALSSTSIALEPKQPEKTFPLHLYYWTSKALSRIN